MELKSAFEWKPLPEVIDEERHRERAEKLERVTRETEAYWNKVMPSRATPVRPFTLADGVELLLFDLRRYQAAMARTFEKEQEQKELLDHKTATGQEVEADPQRWLAYLDIRHVGTAALNEQG